MRKVSDKFDIIEWLNNDSHDFGYVLIGVITDSEDIIYTTKKVKKTDEETYETAQLRVRHES